MQTTAANLSWVSGREERPIPAEGLLHPLALLAIGLLLFNDHLLKTAWPGWWTGKLSDLAGLAFFPLFLQGLIELGQACLGRFRAHSRWVLLGATLATGAVFAAVQLWPFASDAYRMVWGGLAWPLQAFGAVLSSGGLPGYSTASLTPDPGDLLALPAVGLGLLVAIRPGSRSPR